jgi:uncharacterized membrane protein
MASPRLLDVLPELVREGLITAEQSERIRARYPMPTATGRGDRTIFLFGILGALLIGLGVILVVAHNWDDLQRWARTALVFLLVMVGQALVVFAMQRRRGVAAWREGSALVLACALCAAVALLSQIHHINGEMESYLLLCSLLVLPLLYVPGSLLATIGYLAMITWYGALVADDRWAGRPWLLIPLLLAAVPAYLREARNNGTGAGFWWLSLAMALATGLSSQFFYNDWKMDHVLGLMALTCPFTLVPCLHQRNELRTWPWALVGGATALITLFVFSYHTMWQESTRLSARATGSDLVLVLCYAAVGSAVYLWSRKRRKALERWPWPEAWWLFLLCYAVAFFSPILAAVLTNLALLAVGVVTVKHGIESDSLRRMNAGLATLSLTILLRFFDTDLSFVLRGLVFIAIGAGFLYMNLRMVRRRQQERHEA